MTNHTPIGKPLSRNARANLATPLRRRPGRVGAPPPTADV